MTQSAITSPSDPFFGFDQQQTQNVTVSGTSNGTTGMRVDIDCYTDDGSTGTNEGTLVSDLQVGADGSFSTSVSISALGQATDYGECRLRAVPAETSPTAGLAAFAGPRTLVGSLPSYSYIVGSSTNVDFYILAPQLGTVDDYDSFGGCGLDDSYTMDPSVFGQKDSGGFNCVDWTEYPAASDSSRSGIEVDGHPAYAPANAADINSAAPGLPALTITSITQDSSNGNLTVVETEPLVRCDGDAFPPTSGNCTTFIASGVLLTRTITQFDSGHMVHIQDVYTSTDGSSHTLDLLLEQDLRFGDENQLSYEFPGESAFTTHASGDQVTAAGGAPQSILIENNTEPDGSTAGGRGAITYDQAPSGPFALTSPSSFDAPNQLTVPATGSATLGYTYSSETTQAAVNADVLTADDIAVPPAAVITSPPSGASVSSSPQTVTGTASAGSGVAGVTVNGVAATVAGDGTWTVSIPLSAGANVISVVVTSNAGNTATSSETVTLAPATTGAATTPPAATTTPTPTALAAAEQTTAGQRVRGQSAVLGGLVAGHAAAVTYHFQYGVSNTYGKTTAPLTLAASATAQSVAIAVRRLLPGTVYHYRLAVADGAGKVSYGADETVRTPRVKPRRVRDHIFSYWDQHAPYRYRLHGRMVLPHGLAHAAACRTRGRVTVTVTNATKIIARRRLTVSAHCTYDTTFQLSADQLHGAGRLAFHMHFAGNHQLRARRARTLNVLYGPGAKAL